MAEQARVFDNTETDQIDEVARSVVTRWSSGELTEDEVRRELLRLALDGSILISCVRQQSVNATAQSRTDMYDLMVDLLQHKIVTAKEGSTPLDLGRLAAGDALTAWVRETLTGAGPYLRHRIQRAEQQRLRRISRIAREMEDVGSQMAWGTPEVTPEDVVLGNVPAPGPGVDPTEADPTRALLLADGSEVAARAAAFRARGSSFRGSRRLSTQVALAAQMLQLDPPPRLPLSRWSDRQEIRDWCQENGDGARLRRLLSQRRTGRDAEGMTDIEAKVLAIFDGYTLAQAASLTSKPGYVLVHMAQAAVEPTPPPPTKVVHQMAAKVTELMGQVRRSGRLVRTWAAATAELTASEYAGRGAVPKVKTVEQLQADIDLFHAEVDKMVVQDEMVALGASREAVRAFLDRLHEQLLVAELDAQVFEWVGSEGSPEHSA